MHPKQRRSSMILVAALQAAIAQTAFAQQNTPKAAPEMAPQQIEQIVVQGQFLGEGSQSAMKLDIAVRDTPFSVSSYSDSFMKAIETSAVAEMYNYMTGVKRAGNTAYDITIRGFKTSNTDKNAIMVDGLPGLSGNFASPSTIGVDHVELVKGPMSVLYGQIQPGGFVNMISKKPKAQFSAEAEIRGQTYWSDHPSFGDRNGYTGDIDVTGPIDKDGKFLYRIVGEYSDRDLWRDYTWEKTQYIAPSFTWNISDLSFLTLQYDHRHVENAYDDGLVAPNFDIRRVAPRYTYYHEPTDARKETGDAYSAQAGHAFSDALNWNFAVRSVHNTNDDRAYANVAIRPNNTTLQRRARLLHAVNDYNYFDTNLTWQGSTWGVKNHVLLGVNAGEDKQHQWRERFFNGGNCPGPTCLDIDIYHPVYGAVPAMESLPPFSSATVKSDRYFKSRSRGYYVSDLMTFSEQWKATWGIRNVHERQTIQEVAVASPLQEKTADKGAIPMVGVLFQPNKAWTLYASYAESYVPIAASEQDVNGRNPFVPIEGKQYEAGVKGEGLLGGGTNATASLFRIDRNNTTNTFSCPRGTCSEQLGSERSQGIEIEINTKIQRNWQLIFGYTFLDATVRSSRDPVQVGARLPNVAKNSFNVWSRYDIKAGWAQGLGIGVGVVYTGDRNGLLPTTASPNAVLSMPSYTVVDTALTYVWNRYTFNLKIGNVFDKVYYESAGSLAQVRISPGAPRNAVLSVRVSF